MHLPVVQPCQRSLLGRGITPHAYACLRHRLLIAGRAEVSTRGVAVLQPLLLGWASLAARHLVPGGLPRVRQELRTLVASYDASHLGPAVLERLAAAGFADVAAAVAARCACLVAVAWVGQSCCFPCLAAVPPCIRVMSSLGCPFACSSDSPAVTPAHKAVLQAAAGDWQPLLLLVMQEWEASPYHPG